MESPIEDSIEGDAGDGGDPSKGTSGRWTVTEHLCFVEGVRRFHKSWRHIAAMVPTRSVVQIRTHAQKFFMKLEKVSPFFAPLAAICARDGVRSHRRRASPSQRSKTALPAPANCLSR
jgi:SHAQKYF class myb-like DNA-binding protein